MNIYCLSTCAGVGDGYAIIKSYSRRGEIAKLYSPHIFGSVCMRFYFYLRGNETGYLKILTKRQESHKEHVVFNRYGNHGHKWNFAQIYLDFSPNDAYQVGVIFLVGAKTSEI